MAKSDQHSFQTINENVALRTILEATATEVGERFFTALVENLAKALNTHGAWVTEYDREHRRLRAIAFWLGGEWVRDYEYEIAGTPCERVVESTKVIHYPENVMELFPGDNDLEATGAVSFMGTQLMGVDGRVIGHLAVLDKRPMPESPRALAVLRIFASRAAAELQRLKADSEVRERGAKLGRLVDSAMDAIVELDRDLRLTRMNRAGEKFFKCSAGEALGRDFARFLAEGDRDKLINLVNRLDTLPEDKKYLWIPGGLRALCVGGEEVAAEATLSRYEMEQEAFFALILRNVNERIEAEKQIQSLTIEAEYLKEEISRA
ncbi:MAG: PAS domain S-box protein, partial [Deltaproteobacteria bacterium]|nr:PAS domain S-box protein [Deltaproteobacteria bacterium]